ncbi:hypothetical protein OHB04_16280 [Streptomyces sp. NBC_01775]|uniref:DUF6716 putative glycosyltransferase n=1 Tax=Streptomyces sp. NBC_01775 TaxID=2975939 RepID=UPI002DD8FB8C|nr:DUF6716 putative glycosyltransferase [Streptomyces sp. NBC_01775]WSB81573.1 hypothetical protein OHB04_16280 [Streptomyces sp. NBC_01775]
MLADSDTRWKWGALTARRLAPEARIDGLLLRGRATPTPRQLAEVGVTVETLREVTTAEFLRAATAPDAYDVVVLACVGGAVQAVLHGLNRAVAERDEGHPDGALDEGRTDEGRTDEGRDEGRPGGGPAAGRRPVVVTGYVGVVYEKLTDGLLLRHGADLVLANSPHDAERFRAVYEGVGAESGGVVRCALPFLEDADGGEGAGPARGVEGAEGADESGPAEEAGPAEVAGRAEVAGPAGVAAGGSGAEGRFTVVFAVQPSVPASREDRAYLLGRAVAHALRHPEREVLIKLRSKPGEHTTHIEEQPYQKLVRKLPGSDGAHGGLPANCRLVYGHMGQILDRAALTGGLLVTVSSTAALESLHRGVPTAVLTDLGVRETLGNHYFTGSGCLVSWDQLDDGLLPQADEKWVLHQGARARKPFAAARERVAELTARSAGTGLPPLTPYYTERTAPGYLPAILRRYGLTPDGSPAGGADAGPGEGGGSEPGVVRRVVREAARGAYRHGVQRVAPLIRKAGEL